MLGERGAEERLRDLLQKLYAIQQRNAFGIHQTVEMQASTGAAAAALQQVTFARGLFLRTAMCNHACAPNASVQ